MSYVAHKVASDSVKYQVFESYVLKLLRLLIRIKGSKYASESEHNFQVNKCQRNDATIFNEIE